MASRLFRKLPRTCLLRILKYHVEQAHEAYCALVVSNPKMDAEFLSQLPDVPLIGTREWGADPWFKGFQYGDEDTLDRSAYPSEGPFVLSDQLDCHKFNDEFSGRQPRFTRQEFMKKILEFRLLSRKFRVATNRLLWELRHVFCTELAPYWQPLGWHDSGKCEAASPYIPSDLKWGKRVAWEELDWDDDADEPTGVQPRRPLMLYPMAVWDSYHFLYVHKRMWPENYWPRQPADEDAYGWTRVHRSKSLWVSLKYSARDYRWPSRQIAYYLPDGIRLLGYVAQNGQWMPNSTGVKHEMGAPEGGFGHKPVRYRHPLPEGFNPNFYFS